MNKTLIHNFLNQEVDRKEFLLYCGILLMTITGISGMIKSLEKVMRSKQQIVKFSSGPYGGRKEYF